MGLRELMLPAGESEGECEGDGESGKEWWEWQGVVGVARSGGSVYCLGKFTSQKGFSHQMFWQLAAAFFFNGVRPFHGLVGKY